MHALTSSIFLPSYLVHLSIPHRRAVLHTYLLVIIHTALSRGRPHLDPELLMSYNPHPTAPGTNGETGKKLDVLSDASDETTRNAWTSLIESVLYSRGD